MPQGDLIEGNLVRQLVPSPAFLFLLLGTELEIAPSAHPPAKVSPFQTYNELQTATRGVPDGISLSWARDAIA